MKMTESQKPPQRRGALPLRPANGEVQGQGWRIGRALGYADVLANRSATRDDLPSGRP